METGEWEIMNDTIGMLRMPLISSIIACIPLGVASGNEVHPASGSLHNPGLHMADAAALR